MQPIYLNDHLLPQTVTNNVKTTYKVVHGVYGKPKRGSQYMATPTGDAVYLGDWWDDAVDILDETGQFFKDVGDKGGQIAKDIAAAAAQFTDWTLNNPIVTTALNEAGGALLNIPNVGTILAGQAQALKRVTADLRTSQGLEGLLRAGINLTALTIANAAKGIAGATGKLNKEQTQAAVQVLAKDGSFGVLAQEAAINGKANFKLPNGENVNLLDMVSKIYKENTSSNRNNDNYAPDRETPTYYDKTPAGAGNKRIEDIYGQYGKYAALQGLTPDSPIVYFEKGTEPRKIVTKAVADADWEKVKKEHPVIDLKSTGDTPPAEDKKNPLGEIPTQYLVLGGVGILAAFLLLSKK